MKRSFRIVPLEFLFYSNLYIALAAYAQVQGFALLRNLDLSFLSAPACFAFFGTLFIYAIHRYIKFNGSQHDRTSDRIAEIGARASHLFWISVVSACFSAWFFMQLTRNTQLLLLVFGAIALAYGLPYKVGSKPIRHLPYLKTFLVAFVWSAIIVLIPASEASSLMLSETTYWFLERFCFVFAITIPFDLRDAALDKSKGIKTLPNTFGPKSAQVTAYFALCIHALIWIYHTINSGLESKCLLANLCVTCIAALCIWYAGQARHEYFYAGIVDGLLILQPILWFIICA